MFEKIISIFKEYPQISDWKIKRIKTFENQFYFTAFQLDNRRIVSTEKYEVTLFRDFSDNTEKKRGQGQFICYNDQLASLSNCVENAIKQTEQTKGPLFDLPHPSSPPEIQVSNDDFLKLPDKRAHDIMDLIKDETQINHVSLATCEIFFNQMEITLWNSRNIKISYPQPNLFLEYVVLAENQNEQTEFYHSMSEQKLDIKLIRKQFQDSARYAQDSLNAALPQTGTFPVIFMGEALYDLLLPPLIFQSSAQAHYDGFNQWNKGELIYPNNSFSGDALTLTSDGLLPGRLKTKPFDDDGVPQTKFNVVDKGTLQQLWAPYRFASIMNIPSTGYFSNVFIEPGRTPLEDLLKNGQTTIYLIPSLSSVVPNAFNGDFTSEIRLGYQVKNNELLPIKGGSVSGNLFQALQNVRFSKEINAFKDFQGPTAMRFENIAISGS